MAGGRSLLPEALDTATENRNGRAASEFLHSLTRIFQACACISALALARDCSGARHGRGRPIKMLIRRYGLAPRARLEERNGRWVLFSDYPLRAFTLNDSARQLVGVLDGDTPLHRLVLGVTPEAIDFLENKVRAGLLTARHEVEPPQEWPAVEVIIPVYGDSAGLRLCLEGLAAQSYPREKLTVTVVDDASPDCPLEGFIGIDFNGLTTSWRHLAENLGAGGARNAGAGIFHETPELPPEPPLESRAPLLAFVDADCVPHPEWLTSLVSALEGSDLAAAGGGVKGLNPDTWLGGYEAACASLFMGERGGPVASTSGGVPYLPACNLLLRRSAFEAAGGFRRGMRVGEDVDLSWRLAAQGLRIFYLPEAAVRHRYRDRLLSFMGRKRDYARSEAQLRRLHPQRFRSRPGWIGVGTAALLGAGVALMAPGLIALGFAVPFVCLAPRIAAGRGVLGVFSPGRVLMAWLRGVLGTILHEARRLTRVTLVLWALPLALWPAILPVALLVFALGAAGEWVVRRPHIGWPRFVAGFAAESLAYSVGKLEGEARAALGPLLRAVFRAGRRSEHPPFPGRAKTAG